MVVHIIILSASIVSPLLLLLIVHSQKSPEFRIQLCRYLQALRRMHAAYVDAISNPFHEPGQVGVTEAL